LRKHRLKIRVILVLLYAHQKVTFQQMQKKAHTMSQGQLKFKTREEHF